MAQGKLFFDVMSSLDGFMAPEGMEKALAGDSRYKSGMAKWSELTSWVFKQKFFRENLKLGEGGETGEENRMLEETFKRTGASIMGKGMFEAGERSWPEDAPFHTPVYVLTHERREPWERKGGTTFHFVNEGLENALAQAREAAGKKDIRIAGGANVIQQYLNAGLVDEFTVHYAPVFFGKGTLLFSGVRDDIKATVKKGMTSDKVTHVTYVVER